MNWDDISLESEQLDLLRKLASANESVPAEDRTVIRGIKGDGKLYLFHPGFSEKRFTPNEFDLDALNNAGLIRAYDQGGKRGWKVDILPQAKQYLTSLETTHQSTWTSVATVPPDGVDPMTFPQDELELRLKSLIEEVRHMGELVWGGGFFSISLSRDFAGIAQLEEEALTPATFRKLEVTLARVHGSLGSHGGEQGMPTPPFGAELLQSTRKAMRLLDSISLQLPDRVYSALEAVRRGVPVDRKDHLFYQLRRFAGLINNVHPIDARIHQLARELERIDPRHFDIHRFDEVARQTTELQELMEDTVKAASYRPDIEAPYSNFQRALQTVGEINQLVERMHRGDYGSVEQAIDAMQNKAVSRSMHRPLNDAADPALLPLTADRSDSSDRVGRNKSSALQSQIDELLKESADFGPALAAVQNQLPSPSSDTETWALRQRYLDWYARATETLSTELRRQFEGWFTGERTEYPIKPFVTNPTQSHRPPDRSSRVYSHPAQKHFLEPLTEQILILLEAKRHPPTEHLLSGSTIGTSSDSADLTVHQRDRDVNKGRIESKNAAQTAKTEVESGSRLSQGGANVDTDALAPPRYVFIGHGRSLLYTKVRDHLKDHLKLDVEFFEAGSRTAIHNIAVLETMLSDSAVAVILMTGDDTTQEGAKRARQNVVHEAGLFQGKLGFNRVALIVQDGVELFSNIDGLQRIHFPGDTIEAAFPQLEKFLERVGLLKPR